MPCRNCKNNDLFQIYSLGNMPPVNEFLTTEEKNDSPQKKYPLELMWCSNCSLVQLNGVVDPSILFREYKFLSAASKDNVSHMKKFASSLKEKIGINKDTKILEIGSNDGTLLRFFRDKTTHLLGVDPAINIAEMSKNKDVEQVVDFFNFPLSQNILKNKGKFDIILACNVVAHTPDFLDLFKGVKNILSNDGVFILEFPYIQDTILKGEFDTVYHEHVYQFSLTSIKNALEKFGLKIYDVERVNIQGGSLRVFVSHEHGNIDISIRQQELLTEEERNKISDFSTYENLRDRFYTFRKNIISIVEEKAKQNIKIVGLGAPARGVVVLNSCEINEKYIECVVDDTVLKQGTQIPGTKIPVVGWDDFDSDCECFLLLSWNYKKAIFEKLKEKVKKSKVEIIVPFPDLRIEIL